MDDFVARLKMPSFYAALVGLLLGGWADQILKAFGADQPTAARVMSVLGFLAAALGLLQQPPLGKAGQAVAKIIVALALGWGLLTAPVRAEAATSTSSAGFGMSMAISPVVVELGAPAGQGVHVAPLGVGFGASYAFRLIGQAVKVGLYGAPELDLGDGSTFKLALFLHGVLWHPPWAPTQGVGIGLGWHALEVAGPDPGIHPFHLSRLFAFAGYEVPL